MEELSVEVKVRYNTEHVPDEYKVSQLACSSTAAVTALTQRAAYSHKTPDKYHCPKASPQSAHLA
jgi:hypothetical protein